MLKEKLKNLKLLVFDVDGVLTDNTVFVGGNETEFKRFHIADGLAFYMAQKVGLKLALVSGRYSPATDSRAKEFNIDEVHQSTTPKPEVVAKLIAKYELKPEEVSFMGDDLVDIQVMKSVGVSVSVPDGAPQTREIADYVTARAGGHGAVREFVDMVLEAKGVDPRSLWEMPNA